MCGGLTLLGQFFSFAEIIYSSWVHFFFKLFFIYLVAPGLSCGRQAP